MNKVTLLLSDGTRFEGTSFGYEKPVSGEVVFTTAMTGYPESLTDPSFAGQMIVLTYPLVGNYGVPDTSLCEDGLSRNLESEKIHATALLVADYSEACSHFKCEESLDSWLKREHIPGVTGIDTRALTRHLRDKGVMLGQLIYDSIPASAIPAQYEGVNFVEQVSCKEVLHYGKGKRVVLLDGGVKHNIIRCLVKRGVEVIRVPWDYDFNELEFDGLFLSNGPGDPNLLDIPIQHIRTFIANESKKDDKTTIRPLMGICLGNQLLARAIGATVYKLKFGHRSHNQPVRQVDTNRCFITAQNHGYAVDTDTLPADWEPLFVNLNDGSNEGIRHTTMPWFSAQFHPEACSGPVDCEYLFDDFVNCL